MRFGDKVKVTIWPGETMHGYVIGVPTYSKGYDDVVQVADTQAIGMPVNVCWCRVVGHERGAALRMRERFVKRFPTFLTEEEFPLL